MSLDKLTTHDAINDLDSRLAFLDEHERQETVETVMMWLAQQLITKEIARHQYLKTKKEVAGLDKWERKELEDLERKSQ